MVIWFDIIPIVEEGVILKKRYIALLIALAIVMNVIVLYLFFLFLEMKNQGEYWKYDKGVTIEVNNLSNQTLTDLNFSYSSDKIDFKDIGTIKELKPEETAKITGSSQEINTGDLSIYLQYYTNDGEKKVDSIVYFDIMKPRKVVAVIDIIGVDSNGFLKYKMKGFDGLSEFGPEEIDSSEVKY